MNDEKLRELLALLESSRRWDPSSDAFLELERAVAHLAKSAKKRRRLERSRTSKAADRESSQRTGLAQKRSGTQALSPPEALAHERRCYVCKRPYVELHAWYPNLCRPCGDASLSQRARSVDLRGRRALLTGGRVKIGYATALRMLRAGGEVHVTTRFPVDAAKRYAAESDASDWSERLHVHGLDFRDLGQLLRTLDVWQVGPAFDIIINNAAQSAWHSPDHFTALYARERPVPERPSSGLLTLSPMRGGFDQLDRHRVDSWAQRLGEVAPTDMVEAHVVNAVAPFLICSVMRENLRRSAFAARFVVNVSAVEGQFARATKSVRHPHTNMAKAALNMLTRTSAPDLADDRIFMVSVDPGWMSTEGPEVDPDFQPPIEAEDCAARILHPIAEGIAGTPLCGILLKDFVQVPW